MSTPELIKPVMADTLPTAEKRRMLLMRSLPQATGQATTMTWLLRLQPCPLELNAVRLHLLGCALERGLQESKPCWSTPGHRGRP